MSSEASGEKGAVVGMSLSVKSQPPELAGWIIEICQTSNRILQIMSIFLFKWRAPRTGAFLKKCLTVSSLTGPQSIFWTLHRNTGQWIYLPLPLKKNMKCNVSLFLYKQKWRTASFMPQTYTHTHTCHGKSLLQGDETTYRGHARVRSTSIPLEWFLVSLGLSLHTFFFFKCFNLHEVLN